MFLEESWKKIIKIWSLHFSIECDGEIHSILTFGRIQKSIHRNYWNFFFDFPIEFLLFYFICTVFYSGHQKHILRENIWVLPKKIIKMANSFKNIFAKLLRTYWYEFLLGNTVRVFSGFLHKIPQAYFKVFFFY